MGAGWWSFRYNPPPLEKPVVAVNDWGEVHMVKMTDKTSGGVTVVASTDITGAYTGNTMRGLLWWTDPPNLDAA